MTLIQWPGKFSSQDSADASTEEVSSRPANARAGRSRSSDGQGQSASSSVAPSWSPQKAAYSARSRGSNGRLEPVPEANADSPTRLGQRRPLMPVVLLPSVEQLPPAPAVQPELLLETVRSSATSGTGVDYRSTNLSAVSAGGSGVAVPRRREPLGSRRSPFDLDLMVSLPAGSGSAPGSVVGSAVGTAVGSTADAGRLRPTSPSAAAQEVSLPVGSGSAHGSVVGSAVGTAVGSTAAAGRLRSTSPSPEAAREVPSFTGSATPEAPSAPPHAARAPQESSKDLQLLKAKQKELEQERESWRRQLEESEKEAQHRLASLEAEQDKLKDELLSKAAEVQAAGKAAKASALAAQNMEAELLQIRLEMASQVQNFEEVRIWKHEAATAAVSLSEAEKRCEDHHQKAARARTHVAEVERQRKEFSRLSGVQACHKLREELEACKSERSELDKKLKKALPRMERLHAEEHRLRTALASESEAASARLLACREESSELAKTKDQLLKMRRVAKSQADQQELTEAELAEADMQRRTAQVELAKSQRLQREEVKRRQAVISEREAFKQEVETLKERLRSLEAQPVLPREGAWAPLTKSFSSQDTRLRSQASEISRPQASERRPEEAERAAEPDWTDAGARLFQMIALSKERADQRKHLSDVTEEVREQARALEELIALPANDYVEAQA